MAKRIPVSAASRPMAHRRHLCRPGLEPMERRVLLAQTFTVTNTLDDGSTELAPLVAINSVNADIGPGVDIDRVRHPGPGGAYDRTGLVPPGGPKLGRHRRLHPAGFLAEQPRRGRRRGPEDRT